MIADGPCSVIRGGVMHGFPLEASSGSRISNRGLQHPYYQSHSYRNPRPQQHQPAGSSAPFQRGGGSTRRAEKKSNHQLQDNPGAWTATPTPTPSLGSTTSESSVGRYGVGIEAYDDNKCLLDMNGTDLRSASNFVLLNMAEENPFSDPRRAAVETASRDWDGDAPVDNEIVMNLLGKHMRYLPPLTNISGEGGLEREQTFPPPSFTTVSNNQDFATFHETGLTTDMRRMPEWGPLSSTVSASGGHVQSRRGGSGGVGERGAKGGRGGVGIGGGGGGGGLSNGNAFAVGYPGPCAGTGMNSGDFSRVNEGANLGQDPPGKGLWGVDGVDFDSAGAREENADMPDRGGRRDRRPSFDRLAAMIPGVPPNMQRPSSSSAPGPDNGTNRGTHSGTKPPSTLASAAIMTHSASVVRPTARQIKPRKPRDFADARRLNKRVGSSKSCGPCLRGEPRDPAKLKRRRNAIEKYLYKRSRRRFADSTRDQSPSRSRPKAAARRPRQFGKFVKVVKDFVPVTAAAHGRQNMSVTPTVAPPTAGGEGARGGVRGRHSGFKQEDPKGWSSNPRGALPMKFDGSRRGIYMTSYGPHD